jgi:hypothetical protein
MPSIGDTKKHNKPTTKISSQGRVQGVHAPYLQKFFEIDREIWKIKKIFEIEREAAGAPLSPDPGSAPASWAESARPPSEARTAHPAGDYQFL